ncbi:biotin--[acetyl-CoA-carboxylase] ligase [Haloferula sp.]|uniref:biotin--[acetyl-CoA-carboxylase] ligase n=1 Tax=Haloferula sp. TaxID=2497595 RepID=UPI0032A05F3B
MSSWDDVGFPEGWRLVALDEAESTNDEIRLRVDEQEGLVVLAERQTAGRGRRGAAWFSESGKCLTFSVLLRPSEPKPLWPRLSLAAGLAVAEALNRIGLEAEIKWPNDVLVRGKKICGILVESAGDRAIVGIGLNVNTKEFPGELEATSVFQELETEWDREEILTLVLKALEGWSSEIGAGFGNLLAGVKERCWLTGKRVRLTAVDELVEGLARGIGPQGDLVVETPAGVRSFVQASEIRLV